VAVVPAPGSVGDQQSSSCQAASCTTRTAAVIRWQQSVPGTWSAENGVAGTVPATGQAHAAAGDGIAVLASGLDVYAYDESAGKPKWSLTLTGFPAGSGIVSVQTWPGVVTAGVVTPGGSRTEVVVNSATGRVVRGYTTARYGGMAFASLRTAVVVGTEAVTSYDNRTGRARWRVASGAVQQAWSADGGTLIMSVSAGGYLGLGPVTALRVVDLSSGAERTFLPPSGSSFAGRLSGAAEGVVLFSDGSGVTAYSEDTGYALWRARDAVPEGDDPLQRRIYLTEGTSLEGVDPLTGKVLAKVLGSGSGAAAGMYVVRDGVALGLDSGAGGSAWGFDVAAGRITWTLSGLGFPHFFTQLSDMSGLGGLGGSTAVDGGLVLIAVCAKAVSPAASPSSPSPSPSVSGPGSGSGSGSRSGSPAASGGASPAIQTSPTATPVASGASSSATATPTATPTPTVSPPDSCARPELVALSL
jgi:hypothetical protein